MLYTLYQNSKTYVASLRNDEIWEKGKMNNNLIGKRAPSIM